MPPDLKSDESNRVAGWLSARVDELDGAYDRARAWRTAKIEALNDLGREIVAVYHRETRAADKAAHGKHPHFLRALTSTALGCLEVFAVEVRNEVERLGGNPDAMLRIQAPRTEAFAGRRHAMAVALGHEGATPLGLGSPTPGASAPPSDTERSVRGEMRALSAIDAQRAVQRARVDRTVSALGRVVSEGRPIPAPWLRLLELTDWGKVHAKATRRRHSVDLAIEPLALVDALDVVRREHSKDPDCPRTKHEARLALQKARHAVEVELLERHLVPAPRPRKRATEAA